MRFKKILALMLIGFFICSCSKDEKFELNESIDQSNSFVSLQRVEKISSSIVFPNALNDNSSKKTKKTVDNITEICDEFGEVVYYVINYKKGGFIILSADNRLDPIMAFSETNTFLVKSDGYPDGLAQWLNDNKKIIKEIRKSKTIQSAAIKKRWDELDGRIAPPPDDEIPPPPGGDDDPPCEDVHTTVLPLLDTEWYGDFPFSDSIDYPTCSNGTKVPAGCIAVAMAQIMNYHEYPTNYDWTHYSVNFGLTGSPHIHKLMADIGTAVIMEYNCGESSISSLSKAKNAFVNTFGYPYAQAISFSSTIVQSELLLNRPVILRGDNGRDEDDEDYTGHAWVCDGFTRSVYCNGTTYLYFHMNWGWDVITQPNYNGYYGIGFWNTNSYILNFDRSMIAYITP